MPRISTPNRDQQIDRVIEALGLRPLRLRLIASAHCDEGAAHQALQLIQMAGAIIDAARQHSQNHGGQHAD
jgi:hypothetical protein